MRVKIRNAIQEDIPEIVRVEKSWPEEGRASEDVFRARLKHFPQGFFVAEYGDQLVATITSCPIVYSPEHLSSFKSWYEVTNKGLLREYGDLHQYNALYIVSGIVDENYRGKDLFPYGITSEVKLARILDYQYVVAGAALLGYGRFCDKNGEIPAEKYVMTRQNGRYVDPLLDMYNKLGFEVPDESHVIPEYFPDMASRNFAALTIRNLHKKND
jgi:hypothetical protein